MDDVWKTMEATLGIMEVAVRPKKRIKMLAKYVLIGGIVGSDAANLNSSMWRSVSLSRAMNPDLI
jgi:hypothetical protein